MASELIAIYRTYVPFVVRGSSAISSPLALSLLLSSSTPLITLCPKEKGEDGQRRGANQRRSDGFCQRIGFFVNVMLLEETTAVLSFGKLCEVWKELIHTSHFLVFACTHNSGAHDIRSRWLTASRHPCFMCSVWFGLSLRLSTLHSSPSLSSSLSFFWFSSLSSMWVGYTPLARGSWVNLPLDQRSKTTSPRKWQEHQLQYIALRTTRCPLYQRVLLRHLHLPIQHLHRRILIGAENLAAERSGSVIEEWRWNPLHKPVGKENTKQKWRRRRRTKRYIERLVEGFGTNSKGTIHQVYATTSESPGIQRTIIVQNVKNPQQGSPYAMKFEDRFHEERENDNSDVLKLRIGILIKTNSRSKKKARLHSSFPRRNGCSRLRQRKNPSEREFVFDSGAILHRVSKRDLTLLSWRPWGHQEVRRRPTARFKPEKKRLCMSSNWTCSSKVCFLKKLPQFFPWRNSVRIMGIHTTGQAVKNHLSSKMESELIAAYRSYVPCVVRGSSASSSSITPSHISPFIFIIGFRIRWWQKQKSSTRKKRKCEWSFGKTRCMKAQKPKNGNQGCGTAEGFIAWVAWVATGIQWKCGRWKCSCRVTETLSLDIDTLPSHIMNFQWIASKSGTGFGWAQCRHALSQGLKFRYLFDVEGNEGFLQMTHRCSHTWSGKFWWFDNFGSQSSQWRKWIT